MVQSFVQVLVYQYTGTEPNNNYYARQCLLSFIQLFFFPSPFVGKMKGIAFVQDPDGYWIEILNGENLLKITKEFAS